jgi:hypothetical protein
MIYDICMILTVWKAHEEQYSTVGTFPMLSQECILTHQGTVAGAP